MSAPPREALKMKEAVLTSDKNFQKSMESVQKSLKEIQSTVNLSLAAILAAILAAVLATMWFVIIFQVIVPFLSIEESSALESFLRELQQQLSK